ncbi:hypothetical protein FPSE_01624 [Fusarium pseudograminearum CS3096]|uniref:Uncharacterized protein n=1 Tax=Fusarium pseudograminearum (strain CS3096) TaxID=1028729 RepID=K3VV25_FUSPC|nr:hypothetical protein FPSE_01624 [Fusarium pseudograminearum CS3096]EKJ78163.1 hypothetical protein FPSE_01624 [Fusarium pseudograminearum CS3096]
MFVQQINDIFNLTGRYIAPDNVACCKHAAAIPQKEQNIDFIIATIKLKLGGPEVFLPLSREIVRRAKLECWGGSIKRAFALAKAARLPLANGTCLIRHFVLLLTMRILQCVVGSE